MTLDDAELSLRTPRLVLRPIRERDDLALFPHCAEPLPRELAEQVAQRILDGPLTFVGHSLQRSPKLVAGTLARHAAS